MKRNLLLLLFAFTLTLGLHAQNWHPFPANSTLIYSWQNVSQNADTFLLGIRIDSTAIEGNATASYFMRICRPSTNLDTVNTCGENSIGPQGIFYDQDHYFGKKMLYENGLCSFISSKGDTFLLQSQAPLGASWQWSSGVTATVSNIAARTVFGLPDSIKTISLSNGEHIDLAKDNGMVHAFSFLPFAENYQQDFQVDFELFGNRTLGLGRDIPMAEGYRPTFEPGDKLCLRDGQSNQFGTRIGHIQYQFHDTLAGCSHNVLSYYRETYERIDAMGTVQVSYSAPLLVTPNCDPPAPMPAILDLLPYEYTPIISGFSQYPAMLIRREQAIRSSINFRQEAVLMVVNIDDTCLRRYLNFEIYGIENYLEGIGMSRQDYAYLDIGSSSFGLHIDAYTLGNESYRTCEDLHALGIESSDLQQLALFPNPTCGTMQLRLAEEMRGKDLSIEVLDLSGRKVLQQSIPKGNIEAQIDLGGQPEGLYLVRLLENGQLLGSHKIAKID